MVYGCAVQIGQQTADFLDPEKGEDLFIIKLNKKLLQGKEEVISNVQMSLSIQVFLCEG